VRSWLGSIWPGIPIGLLLVPAAFVWLDVARSVAPERHAYRPAQRRVVVLGFDGVDPELVQEYFEQLPTLRRLAQEGSFTSCRTTNPPESPVAWATFATGRNPGSHGVFDFVRRDWRKPGEESYLPLNGMVDKRVASFGPLGFPLRPPAAINLRGGEGFWVPVARMGYRVSILRMPLTFPAFLPRGGELLSGLGVPDLRATNGSYTLFAAGRDAREGHTEFGGHHIKIYPREGVAEAILEGPPDPRRGGIGLGTGKRLSVPVRFTFTGETAAVSIDGEPAEGLEPGLNSRWMDVVFDLGPVLKLRGLVRFRLLRSGVEPAIYASPIQISPYAPPIPISSPRSFAGDLARRLGPMKTQGWPEDTFARNDRVTDDVTMYEEIRDTYRAHERLCLDRLDRSGASLLSMVFTATDRMQHMFFRYRDPGHPAHDPEEIADFKERTDVDDPILESYRWMDDTVAAVMERLAPEDILILVSDHGFHSFRQGVNLNTWLMREGYLTLNDPNAARSERNLDQLFRGRVETSEIDWSTTRAYALGLGQIFLNLEGRESGGIVPPEQREALLDEISAKLMKLRSAKGAVVFDAIYRGERIWSGERMADAPDLQCGFSGSFRVSWQTALLGVPETIFEDNLFAWSGDHCSNDPADTAGFFMSNRKLAPNADPGLEDLARTICALFDAPPPSAAEGKVLPLLPELAGAR